MNAREPRPIQWKSSLVSPFWRHLWITHATPFAFKFRLFQRAKTKLLLAVLLQYLSYFKCECVNGIVFDSEKPVICGSKREKRISGKNLLLWWVGKLGKTWERPITTSDTLPWLKKIIWVIGVLRRTVVSDWRFDTLPINCRRPVTNQLRSGNNFIMTRGNWAKKYAASYLAFTSYCFSVFGLTEENVLARVNASKVRTIIFYIWQLFETLVLYLWNEL